MIVALEKSPSAVPYNGPFAGLGFELSSAVQAARGMELVELVDAMEFFIPSMAQPSAASWGYGLMLSLGRETGGS